ncbi:MAG: hypothetical protein MJZ34_03005 [Paludibacteraceae bacterium]|nr:hypothetical protein [Paludibacteraceae bacterium]
MDNALTLEYKSPDEGTSDRLIHGFLNGNSIAQSHFKEFRKEDGLHYLDVNYHEYEKDSIESNTGVGINSFLKTEFIRLPRSSTFDLNTTTSFAQGKIVYQGDKVDKDSGEKIINSTDPLFKSVIYEPTKFMSVNRSPVFQDQNRVWYIGVLYKPSAYYWGLYCEFTVSPTVIPSFRTNTYADMAIIK